MIRWVVFIISTLILIEAFRKSYNRSFRKKLFSLEAKIKFCFALIENHLLENHEGLCPIAEKPD